jgi:sulfur carrier protein ThiS
MQIMFINNSGGGFADYVEVKPGTTISEFVSAKMGTTQFKHFLIRVNRDTVTEDYVLQENDRVTVTPMKIEGAEKKSR